MNIQEIPLSPINQQFSISLGGQLLNMRINWCDDAGWILALIDSTGDTLINGMPLVPEVDLLEQYAHLGINGSLFVVNDIAAEEYPTKTNLGISSHLYFVQGE
ncbi:phage baseplate plug family protein [Serratia aquatilis]|uniref:Phage baseplate plug protein n=1 Tax=Serratia aquatilis TaxID=1737515 RepID=A0ABV6EI53_9GAMM